MQTCLLAALLLLGSTKCFADRRLLHGGHAHEEEAQAAATSQAGTPTEGHAVRAFELRSFGFGSIIKSWHTKVDQGITATMQARAEIDIYTIGECALGTAMPYVCCLPS